ncbi:MAG: Iron sulfur, CDGSH-type [Solirubrobacterales bacterium]|nr:Iron sulfur, CDGSH-type [Solirubrobacterales bacterium]
MTLDRDQPAAPLAIQLPIGLEQPVSPDVVRALILAGLAARRDGRLEADSGDLIAALASLPEEPSAPPASRPTPSAGRGGRVAASVTPYRDGPYLLRGEFALRDQGGAPIETHRATVALCRCGRSKIRPFCDGTHKAIGFQAASGAEASTPDA